MWGELGVVLGTPQAKQLRPMREKSERGGGVMVARDRHWDYRYRTGARGNIRKTRMIGSPGHLVVQDKVDDVILHYTIESHSVNNIEIEIPGAVHYLWLVRMQNDMCSVRIRSHTNARSLRPQPA